MLVGEVFARMGLDSKQYEKGLDQLERYTEKKALTLGTIFKGAFSFALGIGLLSGFRSLGGAITDFVNTAARTEVLNIAMQSVAKSSGYMLAAVQADKKAIMDLGIAEQEATQIATRVKSCIFSAGIRETRSVISSAFKLASMSCGPMVRNSSLEYPNILQAGALTSMNLPS